MINHLTNQLGKGYKKLKADFGIEIKYLESKQESDYIQNIETLMDEDTDLIIGVGYQVKRFYRGIS